MTNSFDKELLRSRVADKLVAMEKMFDSRCKLTFVMRAPHLPDGDMIVTADNVDAVITALQRLRGYEEIKAPELTAGASDDGAARPQPAQEKKMIDEIPRRCRLDLCTPAERAIYDAMSAVEAMAADVRLTDAVILLGAARNSVADFVDGIVKRRHVIEEQAPSDIQQKIATSILPVVETPTTHPPPTAEQER